jgi:ABC-2 type transport system ATP-binding protein
MHPGRSGRATLTIAARMAGVGTRRVEHLLGLVGLADAADKRVGTYSLGMHQRLGVAQALVGEPQALILDEPANGLDPEGIVWMRGFLREYAEGGRTVLVSSHVLTEMEQLVDHVVILHRGRLVRQGSLSELSVGAPHVLVRTPEPARLTRALEDAVPSGVGIDPIGPDALQVRDLAASEIGRLALAAGVELHELTPGAGSLEQAFFDLTRGLDLDRESA